jgi:dCTP deaminase
MTFWSGEKLAERLPDLIAPFDEASIDCASYRLRVGSESYVTPPGGENRVNSNTKQQLALRAPILIPPGQFGFLVTEEEVRIPTDTLGFISIRAKLKSRGLVNVSGFHVDPGYNGRIIFAVFNAGPAPIHLARGDDCFLMAQLYMAVDGTRARLEERMWNSHLMSSVQGQNDGAGQVRAA